MIHNIFLGIIKKDVDELDAGVLGFMDLDLVTVIMDTTEDEDINKEIIGKMMQMLIMNLGKQYSDGMQEEESNKMEQAHQIQLREHMLTSLQIYKIVKTENVHKSVRDVKQK